MAKAKAGSVPNKALHSRVSYLYQAAAYLSAQQPDTTKASAVGENCLTIPKLSENDLQPASRLLVSDLKAVSQKVLIRMAPRMKETVCKNCDTILAEGSTCSTKVENMSKNKRKPWADVLVRKCNTCGHAKRVPLAKRQKRRQERNLAAQRNLQVKDILLDS